MGHQDHHETPKPSNKWIAGPHLAAIIVIALVVGFLHITTGQCCGDNCCAPKNSHDTQEHHTGVKQDDHKEVVVDTAADTNSVAKDSTGTTSTEEEHTHTEGETHGHSH